MAPHSFRSPQVELHQSEIVQPQPLRIIKRSKTISGSAASGETLCRGRRLSGSSEESRGSPPPGINRSLTVRKLRKERSSVMGGSFEGPPGPSETNSGSIITDLDKKQNEPYVDEDDPDVTPKARAKIPRTMSVGAFLTTELHRDIHDGRYSVRGTRGSMASSDIELMQHFPETPRNPDGSPKILERRFSKSKNFLLRAIGGRSSPDKAKPIRKVDTASKSPLVRRFSRSRNRVETPWGPSSSESECSSANTSIEPGSIDITDVSINSRISSSYDQAPNVSFASDNSILRNSESTTLLSPQITVTPEVSSVDSGNCVLWVAVELSGVLRSVERNQPLVVHSSPPGPKNTQLSGLYRYGYLHSLRIDLLPARNCFVTELVGDLHDANPLHAGETRLILVRLSLCRSMSSSHVKESSSDELIADLELDLADTITPYLHVRLTYKHSGFVDYDNPLLSSDGMSSHTTQLQTDANAVIKRHNSQSAWSPRTSQTLKSPLEGNPLVKLIYLHMQPDRAEEAMKALADDERPTPKARRSSGARGSSEVTVKPFASIIPPTSNFTVSTSLINASGPRSVRMSHLPQRKEVAELLPRFPSPTKSREETDELDPARKIWNEMRLSSRSIRPRNGRKSMSADHFYSTEEYQPTRKTSSGGTPSIDTADSAPVPNNDSEWDIGHQRNRIREIALRNKRSLGADTLRSIAPSVAKSVDKAKGGGTVGGLGLGVGRSWGWGPPWW